VGTATLFLGVGLAFVLVPMTAQHVAPSLDWDPRALLQLTVLTFLLVPRDPPAIHPPNESAPATKWLTAVGRLLKTPPCAALLALIFLGNGYFNAIFTWLEPLLAPRGFDAAQAGWVGLVMLCGGLAGMALASTLPVLVKHLRLAITTAALLAIPLTLGLIGARMPTAIYSVSFALGILMLAPLPLLIDRMTHTAGPGRAGTALSLFWLSGNAGAAAAIAALSPIADGGAWWIGGGLLAAMLLLEAVVAVIGLRRPSTTGMTLD